MNNVETEDAMLGTKFCYCSQHLRVHATGWCSVSNTDKVALPADSLAEAFRLWKQIVKIAKDAPVVV